MIVTCCFNSGSFHKQLFWQNCRSLVSRHMAVMQWHACLSWKKLCGSSSCATTRCTFCMAFSMVDQKMVHGSCQALRKEALFIGNCWPRFLALMVQKSGEITSWGNGSLSHYLQGFIKMPGGCLGFLPSTVRIVKCRIGHNYWIIDRVKIQIPISRSLVSVGWIAARKPDWLRGDWRRNKIWTICSFWLTKAIPNQENIDHHPFHSWRIIPSSY